MAPAGLLLSLIILPRFRIARVEKLVLALGSRIGAVATAIDNSLARRSGIAAWRWLRTDLGYLGWTLISATLLTLGYVSHMFWVEWSQTRAAIAYGQAARPRGFIGIGAARAGDQPPPQFIHHRAGKTFLWGKPGRSRLGWYDVTDCVLPLEHFNFEMALYAGVENPIRVPADHTIAQRLMAGDAVIGVTVAGKSCAYPDTIMRRVVVVNDELGGHQVAVLYLPPRYGDSAFVYGRDVLDPPPMLALTGYVYADQPVLFDRRTESLWHASLGSSELIAVSGPLRGKRLPLLTTPERVSWRAWQTNHDDTVLLIGADRGYAPVPERFAKLPLRTSTTVTGNVATAPAR